MSLLKTIINVLVMIALAMHPAFAQTAGPDSAVGMIPRIDIRVRPVVPTTIPLNVPAQIDLGFLNVPGASATLTQGVTVKAFTRYVEFQGKKIGQIVLVGIEKNGRREALPADAYSTQFDLTTAELDTTNEVVVPGDGAALVAALVRLSEAAPEIPQEPDTTAADENSAQPQNGDAGGGNDQAASYQTPEAVTVTPEATEAVRVTTAGCPIRIDLGQHRAIQQSKTETTKGAALVSESSCTDSTEGFDLQKSYAVCSDKVDLTARIATAQYLLFYIDAGGSRQEVTECASDTEKVFPIVEKFDACTTFLDYTAKKAIPQSTLTYQNDNNAEVQVRGCLASETKLAVPINSTASGCAIRHDFSLGKSFQQSTYNYELDGIIYTAGGCTDDGTTFTHNTVTLDTVGNTVCPVVVDYSLNKATTQNRVQISINGVAEFISECTPDPSGDLALTATTDGCTNPAFWQHDTVAGQSYGQERHYYTLNGTKEYANVCQNSQTTYAHQTETTGWQNHDDQLFAFPLETIYINAPTGRHDIVVSQVQSGATQMPFQLTGTTTVETGLATYTGCDKYADTQIVEQWKRPDATTHEKPIGPGAPVGPNYVCALTVTASWPLLSTSAANAYGCIYGYNKGEALKGWNTTGYGSYGGTKTLTREDGEVISSTNGAGSYTCGTGACNAPGSYPACPNPITSSSQIINWRNTLGWW